MAIRGLKPERWPTKRSVALDPAQEAWLFQRRIDTDQSIGELIRRGVTRAMAADPITTDLEVNEQVADYLKFE